MVVSILCRRLRLIKPQRLYQQIRTGYIVLLPEVNPEPFEQNPLYKNGLPDIENITQNKCVTTLGKYLLDFEHGVRQVENNIIEKPNDVDLFDDILDPIEECSTKLETTWGLVKALYLVDKKIMPAEGYLSLHDRARRARSLKYNSRYIYNFFKNCDISKLTEEEQRVVSKFILEGKLNGLNLNGLKSETYAEISKHLATEIIEFNRRVQISSRRFSHTIGDASIMRDFPENILQQISLVEDPYKGPWKVTINYMGEFLKYCPNSNLKWNIWLASRQIASSFGPKDLQNSQTLEKIRSLRRDLAKLLGYESFAHMSMETKMAGSIENLQNTFDQILNFAKPQQENELNLLQNFAEQKGFDKQLNIWDIPYWERKQKIELYNWDDEKMKEYLPYDKVLKGLFNILMNYFNIKIEELQDAPSWHKDCKAYNVFEPNATKPIATLYIDPFRRANKIYTEIGQVISIRPMARTLGSGQPPIAAIILNLPGPSANERPSLLSLNDVTMLFSKFGEALQQVLSAVNYLEVSGLNNIEWDAVHIVSNFMSYLLTDPTTIEKISGHYKTNEPIPVKDLTPILTHMAGYHICNDIYLANLDISLHNSNDFWLQIIRKLWPKHYCLPLDKNDQHPVSFAASVSQQTSCAVYAKLWSKILAADAYFTFKMDSEKHCVGTRFRDTFLAFGGGCHASEVFRRFQGRDPTLDSFIALNFPNKVK